MITEEIAVKKIKDVVKPTPIDRESPFKYEELFFSITDEASRVTFANEVFLRISKYEKDEILGQLHKIIRHPDMPRAVFNIFWDYLKAGKPVASYVKNLAKDGSYYWVLALAFPCEGGYESIRLKPGSDLFDTTKEIYKKTLQHEKNMELQVDKKTAMESAQEYLLDLLKKEGFADFDEYMWTALQKEMGQRESYLEHSNLSMIRQGDDVVPASMNDLQRVLKELFFSLRSLVEVNQTLVDHSDFILKLARSILLLSLNAQIGSVKLDQTDMSLSVVAEKMGEQSVSGEEKLLGIKENILLLSNLIKKLNFDIIITLLQVEMTIFYLKEVSWNKESKENEHYITSEKAIDLLYGSFVPTLMGIRDGVGKLPKFIVDLQTGVKEIERFLMVLRFIHITGKVEIARMNEDAKSFATTFQDLLHEIESAESHLHELAEIVGKNRDNGHLYSRSENKLRDLIPLINSR